MKILILLILLTGCAGQQVRQPAAVEVHDAVAVKCIKVAPARPNYATERLSATATDIQYGDALAGDWVLSRGYEKEMEIAIRACIE